MKSKTKPNPNPNYEPNPKPNPNRMFEIRHSLKHPFKNTKECTNFSEFVMDRGGFAESLHNARGFH